MEADQLSAPKGGDVVVKSLDMPQEMRDDAIKAAKEALQQQQPEREIAKHIKTYFDKRYQPTWHCIVGQSFGSYVTHESNHFVYFTVGNIAILLFKTGT